MAVVELFDELLLLVVDTRILNLSLVLGPHMSKVRKIVVVAVVVVEDVVHAGGEVCVCVCDVFWIFVANCVGCWVWEMSHHHT